MKVPVLTLGQTRPSRQGLAYLDPGRVTPAQFGAQIAEGLGAIGDAVSRVYAETQGPLDDITVQKNQLYVNEANDKWMIENPHLASDPNYPKLSSEAFAKNEQAAQERLRSEGYVPSQQALQRMQIDNLQLRGSYGHRALVAGDSARRLKIMTGAEENLNSLRATGIEYGDMEGLNQNTEKVLATAKQSLAPIAYEEFRQSQLAKNGQALLAHLDRLQEKTLRPDSTEQELMQAQIEGEAEMQVAIERGWIDAAVGDSKLDTWKQNFTTRHFNALSVDERARHVESTGTGLDAARELLYREEQREPWTTTHWDVDHHRIGYSSDTVTLPDGTVKEVTQGMTITKEDAERDLSRRIQEASNMAANAIGGEQWGALSAGAQAAVISVIYNYGRLPPNVAAAAQTGDKEALARSIEALSSNKARRQREAALVRSGIVGTPHLKGVYGGLPSDTQSRLVGQLQTDLAQREAAMRAEITRAQTAADQQMNYRIASMVNGGPAVEVSEIQSMVDEGNINAGQGAARIKQLNEVNGLTNATARAVSEINSGASYNPFDSGDRKKADLAYDFLSKGLAGDALDGFVDHFISQTGVIPSAVTSSIKQRITSTDSAAMASGLQYAMRLAAHPQALSATEVGRDVADVAAAAAGMLGRGDSLQQVAERMAQWNTPDWKDDSVKLQDEMELHVKELKTSDVTDLFKRSVFQVFGLPQTIDQKFEQDLMADYRAEYRQAFIEQHGDEAAAKAVALNRITNIYGVSHIGGRNLLMKFPPEQAPSYPAVNGGHEYLETAVMAQIGLMTDITKVQDVTLAPYQLANGAGTASDWANGRPVRYRLRWREPDENGQLIWQESVQAFNMTPDEIKQSKVFMELENEKRVGRGIEKRKRELEGDNLFEELNRMRDEGEFPQLESGMKLMPVKPDTQNPRGYGAR